MKFKENLDSETVIVQDDNAPCKKRHFLFLMSLLSFFQNQKIDQDIIDLFDKSIGIVVPEP